MTLKPSYFRAFVKTFLWFFLLIGFVAGLLPYLRGKTVHIGDVVSMSALGAAIFGTFGAVAFTPREISWDDSAIRVTPLLSRAEALEWVQLEGWSPYGKGVFLIRFEGHRTFQIAPAGFRAKEWKAFRSFLEQNFRDKKTLIWIGARPVRFGNRKG